MQSLQIIPATKADIPELVSLLTAAVGYKVQHADMAWGTGAYTETEVTQLLEAGSLYTARIDDEVVATLVLQWEDEMWEPQAAQAGYVHRLAVKQGFHGQNLGQQLLDWAASETTKRGRHYLRLDCPAANTKLCAYYESCGFTKVGTKPDPIHEDYTPALYERRLTNNTD
jgi:ribosomal protein S18 acetylase RimI-like enzyme